MNKKCIIVINKKSGSYKLVHENSLYLAFGEGFDTSFFYIDFDHPFLYTPCDRVVVCGGDGTFNSVINLYHATNTEIVYFPCGTLNETSKHDLMGTGDFFINECGSANNKYFSYVLATGTFTPLGYVVDTGFKQKFKTKAYIISVLRQLKVWRVKASLKIDTQEEQGEYCLIMMLDSPQCFGLRFNKLFFPGDGKMHLLAVKSPRFNGFFGLAEMFFSFFRAFFIGFKKPYVSKKMLFKEVTEVQIKTDKEYDFCADGDKWTLPTDFTCAITKLTPPVHVVTEKGLRNLLRRE